MGFGYAALAFAARAFSAEREAPLAGGKRPKTETDAIPTGSIAV
jgi:hypothetical protein